MSVRAFAITGLVTALDCKAYLSKKQHLMVAFGKKNCYNNTTIITDNGGIVMGIHYDYKSTRGAKKLQKHQEREQRRRSKKVQRMPAERPDESKPLTLDMITDPTK